jgi:hypothetical protein
LPLEVSRRILAVEAARGWPAPIWTRHLPRFEPGKRNIGECPLAVAVEPELFLRLNRPDVFINELANEDNQ